MTRSERPKSKKTSRTTDRALLVREREERKKEETKKERQPDHAGQPSSRSPAKGLSAKRQNGAAAEHMDSHCVSPIMRGETNAICRVTADGPHRLDAGHGPTTGVSCERMQDDCRITRVRIPIIPAQRGQVSSRCNYADRTLVACVRTRARDTINFRIYPAHTHTHTTVR